MASRGLRLKISNPSHFVFVFIGAEYFWVAFGLVADCSYLLVITIQPQDAYGLEKLATEELCKHYTKDFGIECRIGRFHNIYGPFGTWKGKFTVI